MCGALRRIGKLDQLDGDSGQRAGTPRWDQDVTPGASGLKQIPTQGGHAEVGAKGGSGKGAGAGQEREEVCGGHPEAMVRVDTRVHPRG